MDVQEQDKPTIRIMNPEDQKRYTYAGDVSKATV
jgi:hypothetical protein